MSVELDIRDAQANVACNEAAARATNALAYANYLLAFQRFMVGLSIFAATSAISRAVIAYMSTKP
jgi:hypothetical protein